MPPSMTVSELVNQLVALQLKHGPDLPVWVLDNDYIFHDIGYVQCLSEDGTFTRAIEIRIGP